MKLQGAGTNWNRNRNIARKMMYPSMIGWMVLIVNEISTETS